MGGKKIERESITHEGSRFALVIILDGADFFRDAERSVVLSSLFDIPRYHTRLLSFAEDEASSPKAKGQDL